MGCGEIQVDVTVLTSDVMAGAWGTAGPAPDVLEGTVCCARVSCSVSKYLALNIHITKECTLVVSGITYWLECMRSLVWIP